MQKRSRFGLIVNPIAGMGGSVGLKGTDGPGILTEARTRGAVPRAPERTILTLTRLAIARQSIELFAAPGEMGEIEARAAGFAPRVIGHDGGNDTTAEHTQRAARAMAAAGIDLLLFAGDGTARDIQASIGSRLPVIGIPSGVKMHSAVYATSPQAAAELALRYLRHPLRLRELEVMDIDEEAYRQGAISAALYGYLDVPYDRDLVQGVKVGHTAGEIGALNGIAKEVIGRLLASQICILGPGTTTRAIADAMGLGKTLLGVDVICDGRVIAADATECDILATLQKSPAGIVVVTPIGGQGHILGRGNQQISAAVLRRVGVAKLTVVASTEKLASLRSQTLRVDTGETELDHQLCGYRRIITGCGSEAVCRVTT
jgi:predicted polyphosphate/ATP-dependent NAD kinase